MLRIRKHLPSEVMPSWLTMVTSDTIFNRNDVLTNSIYYPGSGIDGRPLEAYAGFSHSFVYVDYNVEREKIISNIPEIAGYKILLIKNISKDDLSPNETFNAAPKASDFGYISKRHESPPELVRRIRSHAKAGVNPFCVWAVMERNATTNPSHGPERFSLLSIFGEGVATYEAIYNSNHLCPKAIIIWAADIGCGGNWTIFEKHGYPYYCQHARDMSITRTHNIYPPNTRYNLS